MKLEVKENLVSSLFDFSYDVGSCRIKQLHADFNIRLFLGETVEEFHAFVLAVKVAGNNNVLTHCVRLL